MSKHLHFVVPDEIFDAWKSYVAEENVRKNYNNATIIFCDLPELKPYLDNPVMVIKRSGNKRAGRKPNMLKVN